MVQPSCNSALRSLEKSSDEAHGATARSLQGVDKVEALFAEGIRQPDVTSLVPWIQVSLPLRALVSGLACLFLDVHVCVLVCVCICAEQKAIPRP
jgi:hypothetical protein